MLRISFTLVEPFWPDLLGRDLSQAGAASAGLVAMALAPGRDVCSHQRQDPLPLARCRPRGRNPRSLCHQAPQSQGSGPQTSAIGDAECRPIFESGTGRSFDETGDLLGAQYARQLPDLALIGELGRQIIALQRHLEKEAQGCRRAVEAWPRHSGLAQMDLEAAQIDGYCRIRRPVCTVVWEGGGAARLPPYPDLRLIAVISPVGASGRSRPISDGSHCITQIRALHTELYGSVYDGWCSI